MQVAIVTGASSGIGQSEPLKDEFEQRRQRQRDTGATTDPRDAHIERLRQQAVRLATRLAAALRDAQDLTEFKARAVSQIAAQHDELERRRQLAAPSAASRHGATHRAMLTEATRHRIFIRCLIGLPATCSPILRRIGASPGRTSPDPRTPDRPTTSTSSR